MHLGSANSRASLTLEQLSGCLLHQEASVELHRKKPLCCKS